MTCAQYEVSSWRDHFPYGAAEEVIVANGEVVARTPNALFSVDTATYEVSRFVKGQGLSQSNPTALGYDALRDQWVVAYDDGGIDLRNSLGVTNIPDLRIAQVVGSKRIQAVTIEGDERLPVVGGWGDCPRLGETGNRGHVEPHTCRRSCGCPLRDGVRRPMACGDGPRCLDRLPIRSLPRQSRPLGTLVAGT